MITGKISNQKCGIWGHTHFSAAVFGASSRCSPSRRSSSKHIILSTTTYSIGPSSRCSWSLNRVRFFILLINWIVDCSFDWFNNNLKLRWFIDWWKLIDCIIGGYRFIDCLVDWPINRYFLINWFSALFLYWLIFEGILLALLAPFPAATLCNLNSFKFSELRKFEEIEQGVSDFSDNRI